MFVLVDWAGGQYGIDFFEKACFGKIGRAIEVKKTWKLKRFDVLRVATGSYTVESKRIAYKKLFKMFPGLQDAKNGPKRTENLENQRKYDFISLLFSGSPSVAVARRE